ncbi:MAG TPA: hypothetical protein VGQ96_06480 [Candidatus Eremiobacteraceae bacterium]|nr:hypothetical protein [Candidatus Eremiobacteraceae bacterium]
MQRHFTTVIRAGPIHHTEKSDSGFLMHDGSYVKIKYYRIADDERAFAADEIDARDAQTNHAWEEGKVFFREPYDPRFIAEYRFEETPCESCSADLVSVHFSSDLHDSQHGNGTIWIEAATAHVIRLTYTPNQLPPHATSGSVTETNTEALPNLWYVTRIESTYKGHAFVLRGSATFTATFDRFQRFGKEDVAYEAVQDGTI